MTYPQRTGIVLALMASSAAAQDAPKVTQVDVPAGAGVTVIINANVDQDLQDRLADARARLAQVEEDAASPERALAVLLLLGKPGLTSLVRADSRRVDRGIQRAELDVYLPPDGSDLVGAVVELVNPRGDEPWKPDDPVDVLVKIPPRSPEEIASRTPIRSRGPIRAAALRLAHPDAPGYKQRIALVFDAKEAGLDLGPVSVELQRAGRWSFEFAMTPADLVPPNRRTRAPSPTDRYRVPRPRVHPAFDAR